MDPRIVLALGLALAFSGVVGWALWERGERLQCKVELVAAVDQAKILQGALERQGKAIEGLGRATSATIDRTNRILGLLELQHKQTLETIGGLDQVLARPSPAGADGAKLGCGDYLKLWRAQP